MTEPSADQKEPLVEGRVIRSTGSWYDVQTDEGVIPSKIRGKFRLEEKQTTNPVAVGDIVTLRLNRAEETGYIMEIKPRRNRLTRRAAGRRVGIEHIVVANIDVAWCIQSIKKPQLNAGFIDRFLVMTALFDIPAGLVINKIDLLDDGTDELAFFEDLYSGLGYAVHLTSAVTKEGIDDFAASLRDRLSVVSGPSGAGKSTLLNMIDPALELRTGEVSEKSRKGRHTTTSVSLHTLAQGGYVADTPGMREYGMIELEPLEVGHYFVEFIPYLDECRFPNCTHDHEPGCAVKVAVEDEEITETRYNSYLNILYSVRAGEKDVGR